MNENLEIIAFRDWIPLPTDLIQLICHYWLIQECLKTLNQTMIKLEKQKQVTQGEIDQLVVLQQFELIFEDVEKECKYIHLIDKKDALSQMILDRRKELESLGGCIITEGVQHIESMTRRGRIPWTFTDDCACFADDNEGPEYPHGVSYKNSEGKFKVFDDTIPHIAYYNSKCPPIHNMFDTWFNEEWEMSHIACELLAVTSSSIWKKQEESWEDKGESWSEQELEELWNKLLQARLVTSVDGWLHKLLHKLSEKSRHVNHRR